MNTVPKCAPLLDGARKAELLYRFDRAVEGNPGHHPGVRKAAARPAHFPNALVWKEPNSFQMFGQGAFQPPGGLVRCKGALAGGVQGVGHLTVDVELELLS